MREEHCMGVSSNKNMARKEVSENVDSLKPKCLTKLSVLQKRGLEKKTQEGSSTVNMSGSDILWANSVSVSS